MLSKQHWLGKVVKKQTELRINLRLAIFRIRDSAHHRFMARPEQQSNHRENDNSKY